MKYVIGAAMLGLFIGLTMQHLVGAQVVGWSMIATLVALPLVGVHITIDDDLPGGFSSPDGNALSPFRAWENWPDLGARALLSGFGFAIDFGVITLRGLVFQLLGFAGAAASIHVHRRIIRRLQHDVQYQALAQAS